MNQGRPMPSPAVVVGIDGSCAAVTAALWAVDEAVSRDIPLRLTYAVTPRTSPPDPQQAARDLAAAEIAVQGAVMAVESLEQPVKVEVQIVQDRPEHALTAASRSATMVCLGALGRDHIAGRRVGSVAASLARSAHCEVAVIRHHDPTLQRPGWVVAEVDDSQGSATVLERALEEASLRRAPLRVLTTWQARYTDIHDPRAVADINRLTRAHLEQRLGRSRRLHPELKVEAVAARGTTLNYLAAHADRIQLIVVAQERRSGLGEVTGPPAHAALHDTDCSVLICERHGPL